MVFSNNVLEHVPSPDIVRMMHESRRILRRGGLAIHCVNCGDHYAHFDRSITTINYLTYSNRQWAHRNNRLLYQNRLRPADFIRMAQNAGFEVLLQKNQPQAELLAKLPLMKIAPEFSIPPTSCVALPSDSSPARSSSMVEQAGLTSHMMVRLHRGAFYS